MRKFESRKHSVEDNSKDARLVFRVSKSFQDMYKSSANKEPYKHAVPPDFKLEGDKVRLLYERVLSFFSDSKEKIRNKLCDLFARDKLKDVDTILMVGGYSDSPVLYNFIAETFKTKTVILAKEPRTAVLQGAVMFGHNPFVITERRCRYTYGIQGSTTFDANLHSRSKRFTDEDGIIRVDDIFKVHVKVGQIVKTGVFQPPVEYKPRRKDQTTLVLRLFASPKPDPLYIDEADCKQISSWSIDISDLKGEKSDKVVEVSLCYSEPLIRVRAVKKKTGEELTHNVHYRGYMDASGSSAGAVLMGERVSVLYALNFGTSTCSCYFAFRHECTPKVVPINEDSRNDCRQLACILFDKDRNINAFGYEAAEKYHKVKEKEEWFFFKDFKTELYGHEIVNRYTKIKDDLGREFPLFKVIKETIRYLKTEACRYLNCRLPFKLTELENVYVLAVPNSDSVRRFIGEAAKEADIPCAQSMLCSEAEAVMAYCKSVHCKWLVGSTVVNRTSMMLEPTQKCIICVAGNHWVSFTETCVDNSEGAENSEQSTPVEESRVIGGGACGLNAACNSYAIFLKDVFGEGTMVN